MPIAETALGRLMVYLGADPSALQQGLRSASESLKRFDSTTKRFSTSVTRYITRMVKWGSLAMAGLGTATAVLGARFEQAITETATIAGGGMIELANKAREMGRTTAFTATQAARAMYNLASAGLSTAEIVGTIEPALKLAGATAADLSSATGLLVATMKQFGLTSANTKEIVDTFTKAILTSQLTFPRLIESMKYAGTAGGAFGQTLQDVVTVVASFIDLGLDASMAGTAFARALSVLASPTEKIEQILRRYNVTINEVNPANRSAIEIFGRLAEAGLTSADAFEIFGERAGRAVAALIRGLQEGRIDLVRFRDGLLEAAGATEEVYAKMMDTVSGQWRIFISALQELGLSLFDYYKQGLKSLLEAFISVVNSIIAFVQSGTMEARTAIGDLFTRMASWLETNRVQIAETFGSFLIALKDSAIWLAKNLELLKSIAIALGLAFATKWVVSLITSLKELAFILGGLKTAVTALGSTFLTTAGAIITGFVGYIVTGLGEVDRTIERTRQRIAEGAEEFRRKMREMFESVFEISRILAIETGKSAESIREAYNEVNITLAKMQQEHQRYKEQITIAWQRLKQAEEAYARTHERRYLREIELAGRVYREGIKRAEALRQKMGEVEAKLEELADRLYEVEQEEAKAQERTDLLATTFKKAEQETKEATDQIEQVIIVTKKIREITPVKIIDRREATEALNIVIKFREWFGKTKLEWLDLATRFKEFPKDMVKAIASVATKAGFLDVLAKISTYLSQGIIAGLRQGLKIGMDLLTSIIASFFSTLWDLITMEPERFEEKLKELLDYIPTIIDNIISRLPAIFQAISAELPRIINTLIANIPRLISIIATYIPAIISAILQNLDKIITPLAAAIPELAIKLVDALLAQAGRLAALAVKLAVQIIIEIMKRLPEIIAALVRGIISALSEFVGELFTFQAGITSVPRATLALLHPGEAVIPREYNPYAGTPPRPWREREVIREARQIETQVVQFVVDGRILDEVLLRNDRLNRGGMWREIRRRSGVKINYRRERGGIQ